MNRDELREALAGALDQMGVVGAAAAERLLDGPLAGLLAENERLKRGRGMYRFDEVLKARWERDRLRAQLSEADQFAGELSAQVAAVAALADEWDRDYDPAGDSLRAALDNPDRALNRVRAEAWDEGYDDGHQDARAVQASYPGPTPNPYREQEEA